MINCRVCNAEINPFMTFGNMPIANAFLNAKDFATEYFFELSPCFCEQCGTFQLEQQPAPQTMFHENYAFFSNTSSNMAKHFKDHANFIIKEYLLNKQPAFVVEIGCNDGIFLQNFLKANIKHLGIDPSYNVAKIAKGNGINTIVDFFNKNLARQIVATHGKADIISAANVICHIPNILNLAEGISELLNETGLFIFEEPYLLDVLNKTAYDQIYDEHVFLFSTHSVKNIFTKFDLEIIKVEPIPTHGGSMRYYVGHKGKHEIDQSVSKQLTIEDKSEINNPKVYQNFRRNCENSKAKLSLLIKNLVDNNKVVAGYAATSKSTTILNYCNLNSKDIKYICDTTPIKIDKYSPGSHIPIVTHQQFLENYPDFAILFAWNHSAEILTKEQQFIEANGRWITLVPDVDILETSIA